MLCENELVRCTHLVRHRYSRIYCLSPFLVAARSIPCFCTTFMFALLIKNIQLFAANLNVVSITKQNYIFLKMTFLKSPWAEIAKLFDCQISQFCFTSRKMKMRSQKKNIKPYLKCGNGSYLIWWILKESRDSTGFIREPGRRMKISGM